MTMLDHALTHANMGYPVFRLAPNSKKPPEGSHSFKDATLDVALLARWWRETPDAHIGIATGERSGGGGFHIYLALPAGSPITIGSDLLPAIDWRGCNGYVVAPGSTVNNRAYTVGRDCPVAAAGSTEKCRPCRRDEPSRCDRPTACASCRSTTAR